ncbi:MAG: ATP-binding protein [Marinifilaceae bacterium]
MKEIVIISGKGGTGKTSLSASFAYLAREEAVIADCDVDAANLHLLLKPDQKLEMDFYSGWEALLEENSCIRCGKCQSVCQFGAISSSNQGFKIDPLACEGCGYCAKVCPTQAITMKEALTGKLYQSETRMKSPMVHASMEIGAENSGKMVSQIKAVGREIAREKGKEYLLVDGSPGIGCPVIASLTGAKLVVMVTEPTVSGLHDLQRVHQLVKRFGIKAVCIVNKADLNTDKTREIHQFLQQNGMECVGELPFQKEFVSAMVKGTTIPEYHEGLGLRMQQIWENIKSIINN